MSVFYVIPTTYSSYSLQRVMAYILYNNFVYMCVLLTIKILTKSYKVDEMCITTCTWHSLLGAIAYLVSRLYFMM